jgi:hypothetical protein
LLIAIGVFGLVAMVAAMAAASWAASSWVAKRLRSCPFRLFDIGRSSDSLWHEVTIRGAAVLAPLVLIAAAFTLSSLIVGTEARTMNLQILPGPAKEAGLVDGDHLLEIDGQVIVDWDGVVRALKARQATHEIVIQRVDQRLTFRVTPNDQWHIGIASKTEHHPVAVAEATRHGITMPLQVIAAAFAASTSGAVETAGTARIVRMIGQSSQGQPLNVLFILALLGAYLWPAIIVIHLLDAASFAAFSRSHQDALSSRSEVPLRTLRVARMRQAFNVLLAALIVGMDCPSHLSADLVARRFAMGTRKGGPVCRSADDSLFQRGAAACHLDPCSRLHDRKRTRQESDQRIASLGRRRCGECRRIPSWPTRANHGDPIRALDI